MRRFIVIIAGAILVLSLVLARYGWLGFEVLSAIAFGWTAYPARVLPKVKVAWEGVATALVCLGFFSIGLHRMLRWFHAEVQKARGAPADGRRWSVRWTVSLVTLIVMMFVVGMAATGIMHQAGWLITGRWSLVERKTVLDRAWGTSTTHLKEIGWGIPMLEYDRDEFPPRMSPPKPKSVQSWMTAILPGLSVMMPDGLRDDLPWNDPRNSAYFRGIVPNYLNPEFDAIRSPDGDALSHYAGNVHILGRDLPFRGVEPGEASTTIVAGEVAEGFKPWGDPTNLRDPELGVNTVPGGFGGPSGTGANFVFLDGSVRFLTKTTSPEVLRRLSQPRLRVGR